MQVRLTEQPLEQLEVDGLAVIAFERATEEEPGPLVARLNQLTGGWVDEVYASGEFKGKLLEVGVLARPAGLKAKRLLLVGGGKRAAFGAVELWRIAAAAVRALKSRGCRTGALAFDEANPASEKVALAAEGAWLGDFETDRYKTGNTDREKRTIEACTVVVGKVAPEQEEALRRAEVLACAQNFARELINEPANRMTPTVLAERARKMAEEAGLECEVLDRERLSQLGMGALLGVAAGSSQPPCLIVVRYKPDSEGPAQAHLGLVGKGVTFDSGGISIKPSDNMDKMKYDMAGGAAVLAVMQAVARLKPPVAVTALVPAVENMPGSKAQRPGDIVTTLSGKTVEVLNTDAEGRLILADAITYAKRLGCTHLVDVATLTGAIVVALGHVNVGLFSNDETLASRLLEASRAAGEKMWRMPIDDEYMEMLKSAFADISNVGNRWGGAITAAMFIKEFVESTPWVHLDIAGTAWLEENKPYMPKGPTGVTVRTLARTILGWEA